MRLLMNPPSHLSLFLVFSSEIEEKWLGKEARGDLYISEVRTRGGRFSHLSHGSGGLGEAPPPRQAVVPLLQGREPLLLLEHEDWMLVWVKAPR